jgi:glycosyltransferase involved in cell wall biosynthesis
MKCSIITACLNGARYLDESMSSVVSQDHGDLEYIFVDGGSTDATLHMIRSLAQRDRRVSWVSGPDRGISDAMNKGLALATGEVVAFLHADDSYSAPDALSCAVASLVANPARDWATGGISEIDDAGAILRRISVRRFSRRRLLRNNIILHPATFVRREAIERTGGFDPSLRYAMDYDLWLRLAALGPPVEIDRILANFRVHEGSLSSANRMEALSEEYQVRRRYLRGSVGRAGHACYHLWRFLLALIRANSVDSSHVSPR